MRLSCSESYSYIHNIKTNIIVLIIEDYLPYFITHDRPYARPNHPFKTPGMLCLNEKGVWEKQ